MRVRIALTLLFALAVFLAASPVAADSLEYELELITSAPTVIFEVVTTSGEVEYVDNPARLPPSREPGSVPPSRDRRRTADSSGRAA